MPTELLMGLLILSPLLGFFINGIRFRSEDCKTAGIIGTLAVTISFVVSVLLWIQLLGMDAASRAIHVKYFNWINVGQLNVDAAFMFDSISAVMALIITGVGALIHLFSMGYMSHDKRPAKYFAYLNLFIFNMLLLVLGDNLLVMFVGWEGVGLCSYLLIGFWFTDREKAAAGMKAFITNRIGDAGFLLGMFVLFIYFGTLEFSELAARMPEMGEVGFWGPITFATFCLFIGATGKSAQIPLYVWLPDAMAGPTPVSALIHAATMVTAGVYMCVRMSHVFVLAPSVMTLIATVGGLTAFFAATIGMTQWDIKKVLAYSTVSQLGYMFLAVGVGAFIPAMFHLMTHAFFKALMFLGSGSVIHAMNEEQDIRKMGGLRKKMPITYWTFMAGWVAIIGIPPFAGFFSKDEILWYAFQSNSGGIGFWIVGVAGAALTAFYMTRLMALVFWGKSRVPEKTHPHESPATMTIPLVVLGLLSVVAGWIGIPHVISAILPGHPPNVFEHWLEPAIKTIALPAGSTTVEWGLMGVSVAIAGISAILAYYFYILRPEVPGRVAKSLGIVYQAIFNKYWVDEFYFRRIINPLVKLSRGIWEYIDVNFIDKTTYALSDLVKSSGNGLRTLQSGNMQQYALFISLGLVGSILIIWMVG